MYKIVICDDDESYIKELTDMIKECNREKRKLEFWKFNSGEELLKNLPNDTDAIFLDVKLHGMNGNETAVKLAESGYEGLLVQCSGIYMPTTETVKISPYRYLFKKTERDETKEDIKEILEEMDLCKIHLLLRASWQREKVTVKIKDIAYFTHSRRGCYIHLRKELMKKYEGAKLLTSMNFTELLELLQPIYFSVPHGSYLVNLRYVENCNESKEIFYI
ncbi:MAG: response regulator, partial [Lachnoclostridium sp.]|nr:response regulator [Lachnoclostridium sp.]